MLHGILGLQQRDTMRSRLRRVPEGGFSSLIGSPDVPVSADQNIACHLTLLVEQDEFLGAVSIVAFSVLDLVFVVFAQLRHRVKTEEVADFVHLERLKIRCNTRINARSAAGSVSLIA